MPFAMVNGISLYYEVHGSGPPLVLSHGIIGDTASFAPLLPVLTAAHTVVVYDERGRGQSSDGPGPFSVADCAEDLRALLAYLDIASAVHLGHSFGGRIVLTLALNCPEAVQGLVLLDVMSEPPPQGGHRPQDDFRALVQREGIAAALRYRLEQGFLHVADPQAFLTRLEAERERYARYSVTGYLRAVQAMATMPSLSVRLGEVSCPVLAIAGDQDAPYLPFLALYRERMPLCQTVVIPGAGHFPWWENPAATTQAIVAFLRRIWQQRQ